jgi:hypothetical protein
MTKPLNQHGLRINIGEGVVYAEDRVLLRNEEGENGSGRIVPVGANSTVISMSPGKYEGGMIPLEPSACIAVYTKNDRRNIDIDICTLKGGGEYSVNSTNSTFLSTKFQLEKKKYHENK